MRNIIKKLLIPLNFLNQELEQDGDSLKMQGIVFTYPLGDDSMRPDKALYEFNPLLGTDKFLSKPFIKEKSPYFPFYAPHAHELFEGFLFFDTESFGQGFLDFQIFQTIQKPPYHLALKQNLLRIFRHVFHLLSFIS